VTGSVRAFDAEDLALLVDLYAAPTDSNPPRRPWSWVALTRTEQTALARMIDVWVHSYNQVYAITPAELIPPCWRQHPALAAELAVQLWLWYFAHLDRKATPMIAGEYYLRHLPGFRTRLDRLLGISPGECRRDEHPHTWRQDTDTQLDDYPTATIHRNARHTHDLPDTLRFGFPQLNTDPP
jgi:hypothetical protein